MEVARHPGSGRALLLGAHLALWCAHQGLASAATPAQPSAAQLQAAVAQADKIDANSPAALDARLEYANFLLDQSQGACVPRLDLAQAQLDAVAANPATQVMFPDGWDRAAQLEYRTRLDRAACDTDPQQRARDLQSTLDAAQRAVQIYRDRFDYPSMALAQFNVAATYQSQGRNADATAALEAAIAMDREFGLADDAQDNYATLLNWRNQPAGPDAVAQRMRDFPSRSTTLKFAWAASNARVTVSRSNAGVVDRKIIHTQDSRVFERTVSAQDDGWAVSDAAGGGAMDYAVWPSETYVDGPPALFRPTLMQFPGFSVSAAGDFQAVNDLAAFAARVSNDAQASIRAHAPSGVESHKLVTTALRAAQLDFAPEVITQEVSQDYELEAAMWIGATLQQGVHYSLTTPLALAGIPYVTVDHQLDFVFTRELPCPGVAVAHPCVELIVRAAPAGQPLQAMFGAAGSSVREVLRYSASVVIRIITDPQTLQPYLRDMRRYWYVTLSRDELGALDLQSDRRVTSVTYRSP